MDSETMVATDAKAAEAGLDRGVFTSYQDWLYNLGIDNELRSEWYGDKLNNLSDLIGKCSDTRGADLRHDHRDANR